MVDMPDVSSQYAPVMIAQASRATQDKSTTDRTIGICHLIENPPVPPETAVNGLRPLGPLSGDSLYVPTPDYHGPDRATLLVEIGGRIVRAIYFFNVMQSVPGGTEGYDPYDDKKYCPKGAMWKISLNPSGQNGRLISFH